MKKNFSDSISIEIMIVNIVYFTKNIQFIETELLLSYDEKP